ncbi:MULTISPECIES: right-handed parallel beta-helix repeat-containing protein [Actinomadura]|uniref:Right-handed parallel beta-helix repeat-containing protein n=1 Tax=Actinomadura yumaensis TaxID=111807 RepID=A0ABW2CHU6_9ACTN|nr:right-handed parallel beta-helix repeat-containing protein [Actinomadura sp. J1-007]MWK34895.1 right-handed parallel beta-helix repeat-containing protein [Actinomadura sp. J1-007]
MATGPKHGGGANAGATGTAAPAGAAGTGPKHGEAPPRKSGRLGKVVTTIVVLGLAGGGTYLYKTMSDGSSDLPDVNEVSADSARQQSTLVDQEDMRVMTTRAKQESDLAGGGTAAQQARSPRLLTSSNGRTLMLPQRRQPYYVAELEKLGGQDFQKQSDGSYLLSVNIMVGAGGKLILQSSTGPLTIRMRSVPGAFASIVSAGGTVKINGSAQNPVRFTSWNEDTRKPDTQVSDGRAYIRAIGGEFTMKYTQVSNLGFWSGRTGGVALTGSDRPDAAAERSAGGAPNAVMLPNGGREATRGNREEVEVSPAGGGGGGGSFHVPAANLVSGAVDHSTFDGNAYGIFVTASNQTLLTNNAIRNSLVHGVLLHRFAKNATIENTTVTRSRGDGFVLSRGTEGVRVTNCVAESNGGNGFTLNGQALADGPSASGESITSFGGNLVSSSVAKNNRRYGVELLGGDNVVVQNSRITGGDMGIVARDDATRVQIAGNQVSRPKRQGIVLRDNVTAATLSGNFVTGTETALYLRDSNGTLSGNTVQSAKRHGLTLRGNVNATNLTGNTLSGAGPSAMDVDRATGKWQNVGNNTKGWHKTAGFWTWMKRVFKPMNVIWASVFLLVAVSMFRSRGAGLRIGRRGAHPYEHQDKLEERPVRLLRRATTVPQQGSQHGGERVGARAGR